MDIVPLINQLLFSDQFNLKVATKDWHPGSHISFASNHPPPDNQPFTSTITLQNHVGGKPEETVQQRLWPDHCIQGTAGAEFVTGLQQDKFDLTVEKGRDEGLEMYSVFKDTFGNSVAPGKGVSHDLAQILRDRGVTEVYCVGVAGDVCVNFTALDAAKAGFKTFVIEEGQKCADSNSWDRTKEGLLAGAVSVVSQDSQEVRQFLGT